MAFLKQSEREKSRKMNISRILGGNIRSDTGYFGRVNILKHIDNFEYEPVLVFLGIFITLLPIASLGLPEILQ